MPIVGGFSHDWLEGTISALQKQLGEHPETDERPETETETANGGRRKIRSDKTEANPTETRYR